MDLFTTASAPRSGFAAVGLTNGLLTNVSAGTGCIDCLPGICYCSQTHLPPTSPMDRKVNLCYLN